jgi:hypothetical protein
MDPGQIAQQVTVGPTPTKVEVGVARNGKVGFVVLTLTTPVGTHVTFLPVELARRTATVLNEAAAQAKSDLSIVRNSVHPA